MKLILMCPNCESIDLFLQEDYEVKCDNCENEFLVVDANIYEDLN